MKYLFKTGIIFFGLIVGLSASEQLTQSEAQNRSLGTAIAFEIKVLNPNFASLNYVDICNENINKNLVLKDKSKEDKNVALSFCVHELEKATR